MSQEEKQEADKDRTDLEADAKAFLATTVYREGEDGWAEWAVQLGERASLTEPHMLAVRTDMLVTIIAGKATSHSPTARIVSEDLKLALTYDMAVWLLDVLPKALGRQYHEPHSYESALHSYRHRVEELERALEPFARMAKTGEEFRMSDLKRAREALP